MSPARCADLFAALAPAHDLISKEESAKAVERQACDQSQHLFHVKDPPVSNRDGLESNGRNDNPPFVASRLALLVAD
jgi:hypothetical protein